MTATLTLTKSHQRQHAIADRDGWSCAYCGIRVQCACQDGRLTPATVDHRVAQINGGSDDMGNLVLSCQRCNSSKGKRDLGKTAIRCDMDSAAIRYHAWWHLQQCDLRSSDAVVLQRIIRSIETILEGSVAANFETCLSAECWRQDWLEEEE